MPDSIKLVFEASYPIRHEEEGLTEPSGLALAADDTLWTVSDDTRKLFHISPRGELLGTFDIGNRGLEGLTVDSDGHLWAVDEDSGKILQYDSGNGQQLAERKLADIEGFCAVEKWFEGNGNKGLEGIAFDPVRSEFLVVKESRPGLLIAVSDRLDRIVSIDFLDEAHGFSDDDLASRKIDFSGICYDWRRELFWIVSDKARRVYAYDRRRGRSVFAFPLELKDENREIKKAEGIALDSTGTRLFVVSDKRARLYLYRVESG